MEKVIKHPKKMKNAMYIVFGVFALALFIITRTGSGYATDGLNIDKTLDAIVLYGEVEQLPEDEEVEEVQDEEIQEIEEEEDIVEPEVSDEGIKEEDEVSENLDETVLERDNKGIDGLGIGGNEENMKDNNENIEENVFKRTETLNLDKINNKLGVMDADEMFTVSFDTDGGTSVESITVTGGSKLWDLEVKYSHTPNISDEGVQNGNYSDNYTKNEVITIPGAKNLHITIIYGGESDSYDWVSMWPGSHPNYTASNDYGTSIVGTYGKLGGGNHTATSNRKEYDVQGDTVTFAFRSDGSQVGDGYGYYAIIEGDMMDIPTKLGFVFDGWYKENGEKWSNDNIVTEDLVLYAHWVEPYAVFLPGKDFNSTLKKLYSTYANYYSSDTNIKQIVRSQTHTEGVGVQVQSSNSNVPIYVWKGEGGVVYYYTEADKIYLNSDSSFMFSDMKSLENLDLSGWDTSSVTNMERMFSSITINSDLMGFSGWDTSSVTNMEYMFYNVTINSDLMGLSGWDTSSVTNMKYMFCSAKINSDLMGLSNWDTSSVTGMNSMFSSAHLSGDLIGLSSWNTSSVTGMNSMFAGAQLSGDLMGLSNWDTSKVTNMKEMFYNATINSDLMGLSNWDTSSVTGMNSMFSSAKINSELMGLSNWNTSSVTGMNYMFQGAEINSDLMGLSGWGMSKVVNMRKMFYNATINSDLMGLSSWDTSSLTDVSSMFSSAKINSDLMGLSSWDTSSVTGMNSMFEYAKINSELMGLSNWNTSSVTGMNYMFQGAEINSDLMGLSGWDTSSVTNMKYMFCSAKINSDLMGLSNWDTSSVTGMNSMFSNAHLSGDLIGLSSWNTSSVTDMSSMFSNTEFNGDFTWLEDLDTSSVTDMNSMFYGSTGLSQLDLRNWDTSKVNNMSYMFRYVTIGGDLDLRGRDTSSATYKGDMFQYARIGGNLYLFDDYPTVCKFTLDGEPRVYEYGYGATFHPERLCSSDDYWGKNMTCGGNGLLVDDEGNEYDHVYDSCKEVHDCSFRLDGQEETYGYGSSIYSIYPSACDPSNRTCPSSETMKCGENGMEDSNGNVHEYGYSTQRMYCDFTLDEENKTYGYGYSMGGIYPSICDPVTKTCPSSKTMTCIGNGMEDSDGTVYEYGYSTQRMYCDFTLNEENKTYGYGYSMTAYPSICDPVTKTCPSSDIVTCRGNESGMEDSNGNVHEYGYSTQRMYCDFTLDEENKTYGYGYSMGGIYPSICDPVTKTCPSSKTMTCIGNGMEDSDGTVYEYGYSTQRMYCDFTLDGEEKTYGYGYSMSIYPEECDLLTNVCPSSDIVTCRGDENGMEDSNGDVHEYGYLVCGDGSHREGGMCVDNTKTENCIPGTIENGEYIVKPVNVTWNTDTNKWNAIPSCTDFTCNTNYHGSGDVCEYNTKQEDCIPGTMENGEYIVEPVNVTWNETFNEGEGGWNEIPACTNFTCDTGFRGVGNACVEELTVTLNAVQNGGTIDGQDTKTLTVTSGSTFDSSNYTGNKDDYTFVGWAETSGTTGVLALDPIITSDKTLYAVFKKDVTGTFGHDATVSSLTSSSTSCTLRNKAENCTLTAPTINCAAGYSNGVWSPLSMIISQNANFTASCSDTQAPNISITKQPSESCVSSDGVRANITDNVGVTSMKYAIIDSSSCNSETVATWIDYVNGSTIPFSSEEFNGKYVCFKASDVAGNTSYESTSQITNIDTQGPGVPTLGSPADDIYINDNTPTFSWSAGEIAGCATLSGYTIQICSDISCNNVIQTSSSTTASFTPNTVLADGTYYWRVKETDSLNRDSDFTSSRILKIDTTAPVLSSKTTFGNVWYTENQISEFTYTDTGAGINGTNKITCEISQEGNTSKCTITNVEICDNVGNCNTENQVSNSIKLDRTQPVCGTWTYSPTTQTNNNVTATLAGSTDATSGIKTAGGTCSLSSNDATCSVTIEDNAGHTRVCTSASVNNIDKVKPEGEIQAVTSILKSASQTAKLICSDNVGVTSYYWGTNSNPASTDYQNITSQTNYEITKTVNAAGTYYLFCKDVAGTVSDSKSQVYNSYEVHNMLNVVDKDESTYIETNYTQDGSTVTYIAPAGTMVTFANVYTIPTYSSANMYKGYTTTASGTPDTGTSATLNGNSTYYFWFYRTKYDLNLVKNNGIETIYYKVNGATSYSSTSDSKSVSIKAGSDVYVYAVAKSGYAYTQTSVTNPQSFSSVTENKTFSPTTSLEEYTVTYNNLKGVDNSNPTTFTVETSTINLTNLTKNGYSFDGWYNAENNGTKVTQILQGTHDNLVLYAHWITNEYSIQYNNVEGSDNAEKNPITGFTVETPTISLNNITKNKYIFSGWYTDPQFVLGSKILEIAQGTYDNVVLYAKWLEDFNSNGIDDNTESHFNIVFTGGEIGVLSGRLEYQNILVGLTFQEVGIIVPEILARSGYVSKGWSPNTPQSSDIISNNVTYSVIWKVDSNNNWIADEEEPKPSYSGGGGGGGGGGGKKKSESEDHGSAVEKEVEKVSQEKDSQEDKGREESDSNIDNDSKGKNVENEVSQTSDLLPQKQDNSTSSNSSYTEEQVEAYTFAKANGITTTSSIEEAKMNTPLTRIQMAKMLSNFAINVLGKEPDYSKGTVKFRDVSTKMDRQYDGAVTKSYVLGIMGQNMKNNEFRPNDEVTRAEFVTSLSRLLYSTEDGEYKSTKRYYEPHIEKLKEEGIISKVDPSMKEKRGYVMLMLMRSSKK